VDGEQAVKRGRPDDCAQELARTGRPTEAANQLQHALSFFRSVGARRFIREGEELLAASA